MKNTLPSLYICGTDTGVGKTHLSAALLHIASLKGFSVQYHKPVQCGTDEDLPPLSGDAGRIQKWFSGEIPTSTGDYLDTPCSPHLAYWKEGKSFAEKSALEKLEALPQSDFTLVESAGGVMVPLGPEYFQIDLIKASQLPVFLIARPILGTLNHTFLTLKALSDKGVPVLGFAFCPTPEGMDSLELEITLDNALTIEREGNTKFFGVLPKFTKGLVEYGEWSTHPLNGLWD